MGWKEYNNNNNNNTLVVGQLIIPAIRLDLKIVFNEEIWEISNV